ncbi:DUF4147 domain-containing protein [Epibacterium sp. SM1979]|uniref:DUF4147 domain-containing protein n=1 Tax=Tritonibacter litoralis TaxID=2662264 RepID=A0A843YIP2_9RHOB|nr:DUF4147 domain-containing protein [Tritonibacter litoralis]MQQ08607.1 DUF4147 domain-containing protein [Tritonibacter litoralis]
MKDVQEIALRLFQAGVDRADPARALRQQLMLEPLPVLPDGGRYLLVALGKAAVPMMREALAHVTEDYEALVVTNSENAKEVEGARVLIGSHPVPDQSSADAGQAILDFVGRAGAQDRVIALISGGGSALAVAPSAGISLADKAQVNQLLLGAGMDINHMNLVRQQLSDLKGGGLLRQAAPAPVYAFMLSDVIGDDLRAIASGPTVAAIADRAAAREMLEQSDLWEAVPQSVRDHLSQPTGSRRRPSAKNTLIGSNRLSLDAVAAAAQKDNWQTQVVSYGLVGDVRDAARQVIQAAQSAPSRQPVALLWGGETTVQITGSGRGGRNQELALRVAQVGADLLSGNWLFLSAGTDGRDGPTDAAGGIVNGQTWAAIAKVGYDPQALLDNNDSYTALSVAKSLVITGGTGTNVADIQIFLRLPE